MTGVALRHARDRHTGSGTWTLGSGNSPIHDESTRRPKRRRHCECWIHAAIDSPPLFTHPLLRLRTLRLGSRSQVVQLMHTRCPYVDVLGESGGRVHPEFIVCRTGAQAKLMASHLFRPISIHHLSRIPSISTTPSTSLPVRYCSGALVCKDARASVWQRGSHVLTPHGRVLLQVMDGWMYS